METKLADNSFMMRHVALIWGFKSMYTSIFYELVLWFELLYFILCTIIKNKFCMRNEIQQRNPLQLKANKKIVLIMTVYECQWIYYSKLLYCMSAVRADCYQMQLNARCFTVKQSIWKHSVHM